jgi:Protein of unknown function (DUF1064)
VTKGSIVSSLGADAQRQVREQYGRQVTKAEVTPEPAKRPKYGNKVFVIDGERWHSQGEYDRWQALKLLEKGGRITKLRRQVSIPLCAITGAAVGIIVIDFVYHDPNLLVYEDYKGFSTPLSKWKMKHLQAQYPLAHVFCSKGRTAVKGT